MEVNSTLVVHWGRLPPPIGGVTRAVQAVDQSLRDTGTSSQTVDLRELPLGPMRAVRALARTRAVSIFHLSRLSSVPVSSWIASVARHPTVAMVHAATGEELGLEEESEEAIKLREQLRRFELVWVTNERIRRIAGDRAEVVSPFSSGVGTFARRDRRLTEKSSAICVAYRGHSLYGVDLAVEALRMLRSEGVEIDLRLVLYGGWTDDCRKIAKFAEEPWIRLYMELDANALEALMLETDLLLRPTASDGDSMVVREAVALGLRVVASDVVPRPRGVETCDLTPVAIADAVRSGGRQSDGDGLGQHLDQRILSLLATGW